MAVNDAQPSSFLAVDENHSDTNCFLLSYDGGISVRRVSTGFGTAIGDVAATREANGVRSRALQVTEDTIYVVLDDGIYRSTNNGASFSLLQAFTSPDVTNDGERLQRYGPYLVFNATTSEVLLGGVFRHSTNVWAVWNLTLDDDTYSETITALAATNDSNIPCGEIQIENSLYTVTQQDWIVFDLLNETATDIPTGGLLSLTINGEALGVRSDGVLVTLYPTTEGAGTNALRMARYNGNSWVDLGFRLETVAGDGGISDAGSTNTRNAIFTDQETGDLIVFIQDDESGGATRTAWTVNRIPSPDFDTPEDITEAVLPAEMMSDSRTGGLYTADNNRLSCYVVHDTKAELGTVHKFLYFNRLGLLTDAGRPFSVYQWKGVSTKMRFVGVTSGGGYHHISESRLGGGGRHLLTSTNFARVDDRDAQNTNQLLTFRAYGGGTVTVQFRHGQNTQSAGDLCTLAGAATGGGTRSGNTVTGVPADGTTQTVEWDAGADGFLDEEPGAIVNAEIG
jgi:hypothetical protein